MNYLTLLCVEPVYSVALHPTLPLCASGGGDDKAYLWTIDDGREVSYLGEGISLNESVSACAFSHDGKYWAAASLAGEIVVCLVDSGVEVVRLEGPPEISVLVWHPFGYALLACGDDGSTWLFSLPSGDCLRVLTIPGAVASDSTDHSQVAAAVFSKDGKRIVSSFMDMVYVWDPKEGTPVVKYGGPEDSRFTNSCNIHSFTVTEEGPLLIVGAEDGSIKVGLLSAHKIVASLDMHESAVECLAVVQECGILVSSDIDGVVNFWDLKTFKLRHSCRLFDAAVTCMKIVDTNTLVTTSIDGIVRLWDVKSGSCKKELKGHLDAILSMDCNASTIVTASDDGSCLVFPIK